MPRGAPPPAGSGRKAKRRDEGGELEMTDTEADRTGIRPTNSEPFEAKYAGRCHYGDGITSGELVMFEDDNVVHVECAAALPRPSDSKRYPFSGTTLEDMGY